LEDFLRQCEEKLNNQYSKSDFKLDEGETLLKDMQKLQNEMFLVEEKVHGLIQVAKNLTPLRLRNESQRKPLDAVSICKFESNQVFKITFD